MPTSESTGAAVPNENGSSEVTMRTGAYRNPDDVIGRALQMLHTEDELLQDQKGSIEAKIERAFEQFEGGEFMSVEESRSDMERRKREWLAEQQLS